MKFFFVLTIMLLLMGCTTRITRTQRLINTEEVTHVVQDFAVEMENTKQHLHLDDSNVFYNDKINTIQLQFHSEDIIEICEARELIVDMTEKLLGMLNQNIILGPQFHRFPFQASDLEIYVVFDSFFGVYIDPYYVTWLALEDGTTTIFYFDVDDNVMNCWHNRIEPYSKSREIVVYQRAGELKYDETHPPHPSALANERYFPPE
jgi:hypothetical protein